MRHLLRLEKVTKSFGKQCVVDNVSFAINEGEIFGMLGPNGAGKSTTIRCLMGILMPDAGSIHFEFAKPGAIPRAQIGYLPEERGLYKNVPVIDTILYLARLKDYPVAKAKARTLEYLEKFDLKGLERATVEELSKGMAQKVQFIASIVHEPKLLILDEPFSGLDPVSQNIIKEEVRTLASKGTAILLSAHQMNLVEELCDRIFLIHKGKQVLYGGVTEIKEQFADYKCDIIGTNDHVDFSVLQSVGRVERAKSRTTLFLRTSSSIQDLLLELPPITVIDEMHVDRISLHDIFVHIATGGETDER
ncbi:MAG: ABC transporter ATP-binding protein [Bacillota bacterium]|nr:MAG: ABC transporter ATP-binding protein [Bacillota bacterium]MBS3950668.1 ATP-binding cassette domain-containing protein [Peptococcaceae bacterium]